MLTTTSISMIIAIVTHKPVKCGEEHSSRLVNFGGLYPDESPKVPSLSDYSYNGGTATRVQEE